MESNPYQSPKSKLAPVEELIFRKNGCPVCHDDSLTNWTVLNVAWKYECATCGANLKISIRNPVIAFIDRSIWILMLCPMVLKLAGFDMAAINWSIIAPVICLPVWFVARIAFGTISAKSMTAG